MALVIYDMDDTLLASDCSRLWIHYMIACGWAEADQMIEAEIRLNQAYINGTLDMHEYLSVQLEPMQNMSMRALEPSIAEFVEEWIKPHISDAAYQNVQQHQMRGDACLVISASVEFLVKPIAKLLGIEEAIGIKIKTESGRLTSRAEGILSYQEGKILRLQEWMADTEHTLVDSWFYSDSHNDLPLLELVDHPVVINGDQRLLEIAKNRNWPTYQWQVAA